MTFLYTLKSILKLLLFILDLKDDTFIQEDFIKKANIVKADSWFHTVFETLWELFKYAIILIIISMIIGSWLFIIGSWLLVISSLFLVIGYWLFGLGSLFFVICSWFSVIGCLFFLLGYWLFVLGYWLFVLGSFLLILCSLLFVIGFKSKKVDVDKIASYKQNEIKDKPKFPE